MEDVNWLNINHVEISEDTIRLDAWNPNSGEMVTGYDYTVKDKTVYIKLRGTIINSLGKSLNSDSITINGDFSAINKIVLQGKMKQYKTLWNKE